MAMHRLLSRVPHLIPARMTARTAPARIETRVTSGFRNRAMRTREIKTQLIPPNLFERLVGMRFIYATTITDGVSEVIGRGPTPEASREAAHLWWDLAQPER